MFLPDHASTDSLVSVLTRSRIFRRTRMHGTPWCFDYQSTCYAYATTCIGRNAKILLFQEQDRKVKLYGHTRDH